MAISEQAVVQDILRSMQKAEIAGYSDVVFKTSCLLPVQEFEARINKVLADYKQKLAERTSHHMG